MKPTAEDFSSTDALSLTSDYSTTSSAPLTIPVTISCVDHLAAASSDYASSDLSPYTRNASTSPRHPDLEAVEVSMIDMSFNLIIFITLINYINYHHNTTSFFFYIEKKKKIFYC